MSISTEHLVFSPKYRGKVLIGEVGKRCEEVISEICDEMGNQKKIKRVKISSQ